VLSSWLHPQNIRPYKASAIKIQTNAFAVGNDRPPYGMIGQRDTADCAGFDNAAVCNHQRRTAIGHTLDNRPPQISLLAGKSSHSAIAMIGRAIGGKSGIPAAYVDFDAPTQRGEFFQLIVDRETHCNRGFVSAMQAAGNHKFKRADFAANPPRQINPFLREMLPRLYPHGMPPYFQIPHHHTPTSSRVIASSPACTISAATP